jgi:hypothetical protein
LNQESSPDRLAFQVAHTTISPNYPGKEFETLDRQILVISADVPPQDGRAASRARKHQRCPICSTTTRDHSRYPSCRPSTG